MDQIAKYQQQLLQQARDVYRDAPITEATTQAYLATPRHLFVQRYREWAVRQWNEVDNGNLQEHVATLYADRPLILAGEDDAEITSTISQPSFVLRMLDLLQVQPGHRIFELGAGSGWNAALLGRLAGPSGSVHSIEIVPEIAASAAANVARAGLTNVHVIIGDGGDGYAAGAPYDRIMFTAGAYDLPRAFHDQIVDGGLLLTVIKNSGGGDNLFLMKKVGPHFESMFSMPCGFVQMTGRYKVSALDAVLLEDAPEWLALRDREVGRRPFWWGGKGGRWFEWQTAGIRSFLGVTEPMFRAYRTKPETGGPGDCFFGLYDQHRAALVLARTDELISYGSEAAGDRLLQNVHQWVDLGMPTASSFALEIYKGDLPLEAGPNQWVVRRAESQFRWALHDSLPDRSTP